MGRPSFLRRALVSVSRASYFQRVQTPCAGRAGDRSFLRWTRQPIRLQTSGHGGRTVASEARTGLRLMASWPLSTG